MDLRWRDGERERERERLRERTPSFQKPMVGRGRVEVCAMQGRVFQGQDKVCASSRDDLGNLACKTPLKYWCRKVEGQLISCMVRSVSRLYYPES